MRGRGEGGRRGGRGGGGQGGGGLVAQNVANLGTESGREEKEEIQRLKNFMTVKGTKDAWQESGREEGKE